MAGKGRIAQHSIERVLAASDLVDFAAGYTQLHRRGAEHLGRCPFHDEKTPSFWVNQTKGVYHCFGCGASGDVVTFLQAKQGLDFVEAIELLADRYRVELEYDGGEAPTRRTNKRRLAELMDAAATFYAAYLDRSTDAAGARAYIAERGIGAEAIDAFRIGCSPEPANELSRRAMAKGYTKEELGEARLVTSNGRDFFRGRLMIPIIDRAGRVVGFGARKLRDEQFGGKYVNSADGPLFHKKQTIFLAPGAMQAARDAGSIIVVEGYMDVIALWQAGMRNVCAVMGTALTEEQVVELKRLAPRAVFAFDPDAAGQVATLRALEQARVHELDVRVVLLPDGEDPADVVAGPDGPERMDDLVRHGLTFLDYRVRLILGSGDISSVEDRERMFRDAIDLLRREPDGPVRREQIARVAGALGVDEGDALAHAAGAAAPLRLYRRGSSESRSRAGRGLESGVRAASSAAVLREKRLLAAVLRLAALDASVELGDLLPDDDVFALRIHQRIAARLRAGDLEALEPSRLREHPAALAAIAELAAIADRDFAPLTVRRSTGDDVGADVIRDHVVEHARAVERDHVDRLIANLRSRINEDGDDASLAAEWTRLQARRAELDPRREVPAD